MSSGKVLTMNEKSRITTLTTRNLTHPLERDGCGECQTSCQSACKTSCGVVNQLCEQDND